MFGSAISNALDALRYYSGRVDASARTIARAGLRSAADPAAPASAAPAPPAGPAAGLDAGDIDLAGAMTDMLLAQRAFSAQLRVLETASEMSREVVDLPAKSRPN